MAERYKSLFQSEVPQMQAEVPILFVAGALLGDTATGNVIAQLKFQNIGSKVIKQRLLNARESKQKRKQKRNALHVKSVIKRMRKEKPLRMPGEK